MPSCAIHRNCTFFLIVTSHRIDVSIHYIYIYIYMYMYRFPSLCPVGCWIVVIVFSNVGHTRVVVGWLSIFLSNSVDPRIGAVTFQHKQKVSNKTRKIQNKTIHGQNTQLNVSCMAYMRMLLVFGVDPIIVFDIQMMNFYFLPFFLLWRIFETRRTKL
jgi:hypothetical protein